MCVCVQPINQSTNQSCVLCVCVQPINQSTNQFCVLCVCVYSRNPTLRYSLCLSDQEKEFIKQRRERILPAMNSFLGETDGPACVEEVGLLHCILPYSLSSIFLSSPSLSLSPSLSPSYSIPLFSVHSLKYTYFFHFRLLSLSPLILSLFLYLQFTPFQLFFYLIIFIAYILSSCFTANLYHSPPVISVSQSSSPISPCSLLSPLSLSSGHLCLSIFLTHNTLLTLIPPLSLSSGHLCLSIFLTHNTLHTLIPPPPSLLRSSLSLNLPHP